MKNPLAVRWGIVDVRCPFCNHDRAFSYASRDDMKCCRCKKRFVKDGRKK